MAVELARRIGKAMSAALEPAPYRLPEPKARWLPTPTEPFDERWSYAAHLPLDEQVGFMEEEIYGLIQAASAIPEAKTEIDNYAYWSRGYGLFPVDQPRYYGYASTFLQLDKEEIIQGSLPQPIINYLIDTPYPDAKGWEKPALWLHSWFGESYGVPQFSIQLGTYLNEGTGSDLPYSIDAAGYSKDNPPGSGRNKTWIMRSEVFPPTVREDRSPYERDWPELRAKPQFSRYQDLVADVAQFGAFTTTQELARFAGNVIAARTQVLAPQG